MNVRRFTARTARDALTMVRQALGGDAVVLSTKSNGEDVEVLAMAPESMRSIEAMVTAPAPQSAWRQGRSPVDAPSPETVAEVPLPSQIGLSNQRVEPTMEDASVAEDVKRLSMSTLSFQDYVRERMLKRRQKSMAASPRDAATTSAPKLRAAEPEPVGVLEQRMSEGEASRTAVAPGAAAAALPSAGLPQAAADTRAAALPPSLPFPEPQALRDSPAQLADRAATRLPDPAHGRRNDATEMMNELRSVRGLIEQRFDALAFIEKLQRQPAQARLTQTLLDCGLSPALTRELSDSLPAEVADESAWAASMLEPNLLTAEAEPALEDVGGVFALIGATGVGKTTTTAKIAAAFATKYGAANLGLITLDAYRVAAHEQLRAYGRILGVPVHTAHDRASLDDLLELLAGKKMVLIDTAGMAQRDTRTRELLDMLSHRAIQRLLVVNSASQGETLEDVIVAYDAPTCAGVVLSKTDEAVKLGPAIDVLIRHKLKVIGVTNGQRVPEDWHRLTASALVQLALRGGGSRAYKMDASDVGLVFAAPQVHAQNRAVVLKQPVLAAAPAKAAAKPRTRAKTKATAPKPAPMEAAAPQAQRA
jgi:flagellar biosynthesis protein FlhF